MLEFHCALLCDPRDHVRHVSHAQYCAVVISQYSYELWLTLLGCGGQGWIQTTYLDDELRVGRGDKGSIFLAARQKPRA